MNTKLGEPVISVTKPMERFDWATHPLGSPSTWPLEIRQLVRHVLAAQFPMWVAWGPELRMIYNDAYRAILGAKHPQALAMPVRVV